MLGRNADFLNTMLTAWAAKADYFTQQSPACRERVSAYISGRWTSWTLLP